jgi:hypothetical protein
VSDPGSRGHFSAPDFSATLFVRPLAATKDGAARGFDERIDPQIFRIFADENRRIDAK